MNHANAQDRTLSHKQGSQAPPDATGDGEALVQQIAEAVRKDWNEVAAAVLEPGGEDALVKDLRMHVPNTLALVEAQVAPLRDWRREVCDQFGYDSDEPGNAEEVLTHLPYWRGESIGIREERDTAESALRQVRELHRKVDHAWEDKHWCEADGREWPCQTIVILDPAQVGAADTLGDWFRRTPESLAMLAEETEALAKVEAGAADTQPEGAGEAACRECSGTICGECGYCRESQAHRDWPGHATPTAGGDGDIAPEVGS